jgi:hypothetical protein
VVEIKAMYEIDFTAAPEQIAGATLAALKAAAGNHYMIRVSTLVVASMVQSSDRSPAMPSRETRRKIMTDAYDDVIKHLPVDSPFAEPLRKVRDQLVADMPEEPGPNPFSLN